MAENLDDGEFWLPPQFLADDDTPKHTNLAFFNPKNDDVFDAGSRTFFPYAFGSCGSSETESSDEEDPMVELTRLMTHQLDLNHNNNNKGSFVSGSPQSTLCALGNGCCGKGSASSPNSVCHVTSRSATWDLLQAAAGEVDRMRTRKLLSHDDPRYGFCSNRTGTKPSLPQHSSLSHHQLQIAQFQMLREQQMAKQQQRQNYQMVPNGGRNNGDVFVGVGGGRNVGGNMGFSPSAWPSLNQAKQQQYGSGMRAIFLENPSERRASTGTGVFLPRRVDTPAEPRKKPGCSSVLVPARVVHALNLKVEDRVGGQHQHACFNGVSNMENVSTNPWIRGNYGISQQKRNLRPQPPPVTHEMGLPREWTY